MGLNPRPSPTLPPFPLTRNPPLSLPLLRVNLSRAKSAKNPPESPVSSGVVRKARTAILNMVVFILQEPHLDEGISHYRSTDGLTDERASLYSVASSLLPNVILPRAHLCFFQPRKNNPISSFPAILRKGLRSPWTTRLFLLEGPSSVLPG